MDGNYANGGQPYPGGNQQWQNNNPQWNNQQWQNQGQWQASQQNQGQVKDIFCNLLLGIFILQVIVSVIMLHDMFSTMQFAAYYSGDYIDVLYSGVYMACSVISIIFSIAVIVFLVLDIVKISKAGYKVTGLVLFAILLRPGYYIWRAYILGRKKTFPIIYTVIYSLLLLGNMVYGLAEVVRMILIAAGY